MALEDTIKRFADQFAWVPEIEHIDALKPHKFVIVCGMGGSHLGPWLLKKYGGVANMFIHRDYGLPILPAEIYADALIILSSYSGTTEEVLDAGREALARGLPVAIATTGGKLLEFAHEHALPSVTIEKLPLEPRMAVGLSMLAIARILGDATLEGAVRAGGTSFDPATLETEGRRIGHALLNKIPAIYSSGMNRPISYFWKINFNETTKIPAFCNVFPEMNHNELSGYDIVPATKDLGDRLHALFLDDETDHPRVVKRMDVAYEVLQEHGIPVERLKLAGTPFEKAFRSIVLACWASLELANSYGVPNPETPLIADFKKRILL